MVYVNKVVEQVIATNAELDRRGINDWDRRNLAHSCIHMIDGYNLRVEREGGIGDETVWKGFTLLGGYRFHHDVRTSEKKAFNGKFWERGPPEWDDSPYRLIYVNHYRRVVLSWVEGDIYLTHFPNILQGRQRSKKDRAKAVTGFYRYMAQTSKFYEESS
jgi:hypothetical protein